MSYKLSESISYSQNFKNLIIRPSLERRKVLFGFNCDREVRHSVFIFKHHFQSCTVHSRERFTLDWNSWSENGKVVFNNC